MVATNHSSISHWKKSDLFILQFVIHYIKIVSCSSQFEIAGVIIPAARSCYLYVLWKKRNFTLLQSCRYILLGIFPKGGLLYDPYVFYLMNLETLFSFFLIFIYLLEREDEFIY